MAANSNQKRRRPKGLNRRVPLTRDLLNLALLLAFFHVDPESYLGTNMYNKHNIMDDLSALGRYGFSPEPLEISAYILNAETPDNLPFSAVNNLNNLEEDSGVSDVDSGHQSSDEDSHSSFQASLASGSPTRMNEVDEEAEAAETDFLDVLQAPINPGVNYSAMFETDESSNIFRDLDDILGLEEVSEETPREIDFAPDEEDVENQLMHIDDQLIRLDGNIEDITDHLDEQLLNTATINAVGESHDALLTQEEENYLFSSMPEVMDPMHSLQLDEQVQDISEIDQMIAAGLPSPLMPSPLLSDEPKTGEPLKPVKQEIKEEIEEVEQEEQQQSSQLYDDVNLNWLLSPPTSPSDSLASSFLPRDLLDTETEESASHHLADHNYALPNFQEEELNIKQEFPDLETASWASLVGGASATPYRESRDERKARELNLPFAVGEIIDLPIDAFNELLTHHTLTEAQLNLCRDIRRRGKNKVAAQNCRKRKIDLISQLEEEVSRARQQKQNLIAEREELYRLRNEWTTKLHNLESAVLTGLNRNVRDYTFDYTGTSVKVTNRLAKAKA